MTTVSRTGLIAMLCATWACGPEVDTITDEQAIEIQTDSLLYLQDESAQVHATITAATEDCGLSTPAEQCREATPFRLVEIEVDDSYHAAISDGVVLEFATADPDFVQGLSGIFSLLPIADFSSTCGEHTSTWYAYSHHAVYNEPALTEADAAAILAGADESNAELDELVASELFTQELASDGDEPVCP